MVVFDERGLLPGGDHEFTWEEFHDQFGDSFGETALHRRRLLRSLFSVLSRLRAMGVERVWIGGSFVTAKPLPPDVDVIYEIPPDRPHTHWSDRELANIASDSKARDAVAKRTRFKNATKIDLRTTKDGVYQKGRVIPLLDGYRGTKPDEDGTTEPRGIVVLALTELPDRWNLLPVEEGQ